MISLRHSLGPGEDEHRLKDGERDVGESLAGERVLASI